MILQVDEENMTSQQAFEFMDKAMPGGEAIRLKSDVESIKRKQAKNAVRYLERFKKTIFFTELNTEEKWFLEKEIERLISKIGYVQ